MTRTLPSVVEHSRKTVSHIMIIKSYKTGDHSIQVLRNADGGGGCQIFRGKKRYDGVMFNVICVTRGWVGVQFPGK